jgi:hypothetical protein
LSVTHQIQYIVRKKFVSNIVYIGTDSPPPPGKHYLEREKEKQGINVKESKMIKE